MNTVALVTGSGRGIGYGIARCLAQAGCDLIINDIVEQGPLAAKLAALSRHGVKVLYCRADVASAAGRNRLLAAIKERFGRIHVLVNNAGVAPEVRCDMLVATEASFERLVRINLQGPYFLTQAVANMMIAQKDEGDGQFCTIINIASSNSQAASTDRGEYCISKAGVSMATKLWAVRLTTLNIPVYEIRPGIIKTDMTAPAAEKYDRLIEEGLLLQKRWGQPADIGRAVAMLVRGDLAYSTGQVLHVDGGQLVSRL